MSCLREIIFSLACTLPRPDAETPQLFHYGPATNRAELPATFMPPLPETGPMVAFLPEKARTRSGAGERPEGGLAALAYAPARSSGRQFKALLQGTWKVAHNRVDTSCFPRRLERILKDAEHHFGERVIITSGYRSKAYNRKVRGARRSAHMSCKAADIRIPGVSKTALHAYLLRHPDRGGVGIYRGQWVHVDVGRKRQWDWR
jgi:hypothetical protein